MPTTPGRANVVADHADSRIARRVTPRSLMMCPKRACCGRRFRFTTTHYKSIPPLARTKQRRESVRGQEPPWPAGWWHSRSTPSSGNSRCVPALALRARSCRQRSRPNLNSRVRSRHQSDRGLSEPRIRLPLRLRRCAAADSRWSCGHGALCRRERGQEGQTRRS